MVRIRLRRVGRKGQPSYRIVVADSRSPRDGRYIEKIGFYNPRTQPDTIVLDEARALHWLNVGAQPSEAVTRLLKKMGTWGRFERLRQGEELEKLLAEAEAEAAEREPVSPKTRYPARSKAEKAAAKAAAAEAAAVSEAEEEAQPEAEAEVEAEAVAEAEAQAEAETEEAADAAEAEATEEA